MAKRPPITNRVRELREAHDNMSQSALAKAIGVTRQTVIAIEQGRYSPSLESAFRIDPFADSGHNQYRRLQVLRLRRLDALSGRDCLP